MKKAFLTLCACALTVFAVETAKIETKPTEIKKAVETKTTDLKTDAQTKVAAVKTKSEEIKQTQEDLMMKKMMEAGTPGDNHKVLAPMVGKFKVVTKMMMDPTKPAEVSEGTAEGKWILDGRFVEMAYNGKMMGKPFTGRGTYGYDNVTKEYTSSWMDSMSTGTYIYKGKYDDKTKVLTQNTTFMCPMTNTKKEATGNLKFMNDSMFSYEEWMKGKDGKMAKVMEIVYTRK